MHETPAHPAPDDRHARIAAGMFRMLADPTRVKILWMLSQGECNVNALAEAIGVTPTVASQHLSKLRLAGLVESRREGTFAYYRSTDAHVHRLLAETLSHAEHVGADTGAAAHRSRATGAAPATVPDSGADAPPGP